MKTIFFLRHAKAERTAPAEGGDHARPLTDKGRKAARKMGRYLAATEQLPGRALTSTAARAQETLREAMLDGEWTDVPAQATDALYEAGPADVLAVIQAQPDDAGVLLVVGHEPTWSAAVGRLVGGAAPDMPTAALARVDVDVERWAEVDFGTGTLALLLPPRALSGVKVKLPRPDDAPGSEAGPEAGAPPGGPSAADPAPPVGGA